VGKGGKMKVKDKVRPPRDVSGRQVARQETTKGQERKYKPVGRGGGVASLNS